MICRWPAADRGHPSPAHPTDPALPPGGPGVGRLLSTPPGEGVITLTQLLRSLDAPTATLRHQQPLTLNHHLLSAPSGRGSQAGIPWVFHPRRPSWAMCAVEAPNQSAQ